jgi:uncharacterized protein with NAD-binding domain and iron-sulfur cluster
MKNGMKVLVSGASFAGLSTAYWLNELGYEVTAGEPLSDDDLVRLS